MGQIDDDRSSLELLLQLAEFGRLISQALNQAAQGADVTDNVSVAVMCEIELHGPLRPSDIVELTGLTTGGATKVIDRLEDAGLAVRLKRALATDRRAVVVSLTEKGHDLTRSFSRELSVRISETSRIVKEMSQLLE